MVAAVVASVATLFLMRLAVNPSTGTEAPLNDFVKSVALLDAFTMVLEITSSTRSNELIKSLSFTVLSTDELIVFLSSDNFLSPLLYFFIASMSFSICVVNPNFEEDPPYSIEKGENIDLSPLRLLFTPATVPIVVSSGSKSPNSSTIESIALTPDVPKSINHFRIPLSKTLKERS